MSRGIPAIVFQDGGGLLEHVQDGVNGYVVSSIQELAVHLKTLIDNRSLRKELGKFAREYVTTSYTVDKMVYLYDSLHDFALAQRSDV